MIMKSNEQPEPLMRTRQVMQRLNVARSTLDRLIDAGLLPQPARVGHGYRWERQEIEQAIANMRGK